MARENVLELKIVKMNDEYSACTITKQDDDIIKRGEFEFIASNGLKIASDLRPEYISVLGHQMLCIKGINCLKDNEILIISNQDIPLIEKAVNELNEKHGIIKNWRAKRNGVFYFFSGLSLQTVKLFDENSHTDEIIYESGNYFRTEEQAKECARRIKKVIKEYHKEIGE